MDDEIVIDRGAPHIMKLDQDEQALMDEIQITPPQRSRPIHRPTESVPTAPPRNQRSNFDDGAMDAFMNPTKQSVPAAPPIQTDEVDYGEDEDMYQYDDLTPSMTIRNSPVKVIKLSMMRRLILLTNLVALKRKDSP